MSAPPKNVLCEPTSRNFPYDWKNAWFRRHAVAQEDGPPEYVCPLCGKRFTHEGIDLLEGDHVWPYSLFGDTSWDNYRLICTTCNTSRGNVIEKKLRRVLGSGAFRKLVLEYLERELGRDYILSHPLLKDLAESAETESDLE
jgi:hypothetical protein